VIKQLFMIKKCLVEVEIVGVGLRVVSWIVDLEVALLLDNLKFVPLNVCVGDEQLLSAGGDVTVEIVLIFDHAVEKVNHLCLHEFIDHHSLT